MPVSISTYKTINLATSSTNNILFYGFNNIYKEEDGNQPFIFNIVSNGSAITRSSVELEDCYIQYIQFLIVIDCGSDYFWN